MNVLVGSTDNPEGHAAVNAAVNEVRVNGGELHLVRCLQAPTKDAAVVQYEISVDEERARLEALSARIHRDEGIPCRIHLMQDTTRASELILKVADEVGADRIVIGTRKRSAIGKALLGSTAQELLLASQVPVLAVKATREPHEL